MTREEQQAVLDHCRKTGTWILADEVYERLYYEPTPNGCAPSFLDISRPDDRLVVTHSFSKSFDDAAGASAGWCCRPSMVDGIGKLIEFNTSCASVFTPARRHHRHRAHRGDHAPRGGPPEVAPRHAGAAAGGAAGRAGGLGQGRHVRLLPARRLRRFASTWPSGWSAEAGLGLAPGNAFAPEAQGWLRWCFASKDPQRLVKGVERLRNLAGGTTTRQGLSRLQLFNTRRAGAAKLGLFSKAKGSACCRNG